jgi:hypothetical protein
MDPFKYRDSDGDELTLVATSGFAEVVVNGATVHLAVADAEGAADWLGSFAIQHAPTDPNAEPTLARRVVDAFKRYDTALGSAAAHGGDRAIVGDELRALSLLISELDTRLGEIGA